MKAQFCNSESYPSRIAETQFSSNFLQTSNPQPPAPAPAPAPDPIPGVRSTFSEIRFPTPERFDGEPRKCRGFIMQCSLAFNSSPRSFAHDGAKIAFVLSHLSGKALDWAEAKFPDPTNFGITFQDFLKEFKQIFCYDPDKTSNSRDLWSLKQGQRSVAEFAIDFRIKAAASSWNAPALKSAYFHALSESIKDELTTLDEPETLEDLIKLTVRIDNRIRSRKKERNQGSGLVSAVSRVLPLPSQSFQSEPEPMQIGNTQLTPEERRKRMTNRLCLNCGGSGHFVANCPKKSNSRTYQ
uniref:CCHC-type domain-containing protein n=1 Tax=Kryptolebias marmoratus TaxID=37003 RepID=A0A3Q2ZG23_KRYMA